MSAEGLQDELVRLLEPSFAGVQVRIEPLAGAGDRKTITFVHESFAGLYPEQRYHRLVHAIPKDFYEAHLEDTTWFELAPGEQPADLSFPDEELIANIREPVLGVLAQRGAFTALDELFCPAAEGAAAAGCMGDFRNMRGVLERCGFDEDDQDDIFHVLLANGAFCDCEILANVAPDSRFGTRAWTGAGHPPRG